MEGRQGPSREQVLGAVRCGSWMTATVRGSAGVRESCTRCARAGPGDGGDPSQALDIFPRAEPSGFDSDAVDEGDDVCGGW
jgi:hypothetical protein